MAGQPDRLKKRPEFLRVASRGRKVAVPGLVLQALEREDDNKPRVGFTVTKKVGNSVVRNRTRRRLREALRVVAVDNDLPSVDLVLIGRDATRKRAFDDLVGDLYRALRKSGVMP